MKISLRFLAAQMIYVAAFVLFLQLVKVISRSQKGYSDGYLVRFWYQLMFMMVILQPQTLTLMSSSLVESASSLDFGPYLFSSR